MSSSSDQALVVGGGAWGSNVIRTLHRMGALAAVCEMSEARRAQLAEIVPGVPLYADFGEMLTACPKLPVFVTTPPFTHFKVAAEAIRAGRDVMVEKPMTVSSADARRLVELADAAGSILMVGHLLLYNPAIEMLTERLSDLGAIRYIHFQRLNLGRVRREENVLWSFAPHDIAVMLHLLGEWPSRVSCIGRGFIHAEVEDLAWMHLQFPSGRLASVQVGWLEPARVRTMKVVGERASAIVDELLPSPLTIVEQRVDAATLKTEVVSSTTPELGSFEPLMRECQHFLDCVRTRTQPRSPGEQGLAVVGVLESATESLQKSGEWIKVEHPDELRSRVGASRP